jgi:hypothetical protein
MTRAGFPKEALDEVYVSEHHVHTEGLCFGNSGGVLTEDALGAFQFTSGVGAGVWGAAVQIYAGAIGSGYYFDLDKVVVTAVQRVGDLYLVEFWAGSGLFAAAQRITGFYFETTTATFRSGQSHEKSPRVRCDLNIWGRCKCSNAAASTIDVVFQAHKYPSDTGDEVDS